MPLTDTAIRNAKPAEKPRRMFDGRGLYIEIAPSGGKWFRFKYRYGGKEKRLSLGIYPDVPLKEARNRRDEMRKLLADGIDPGQQRKAMKATKANQGRNSFEVVAREWFAKNEQVWSTAHSSKTIRRLERDIFPWLGGKPISEITPPELLKVVQKIEYRGAIETAHRAMQNGGQVFRYAVCAALKFAPLVFVRPGELRQALWADIDFDNAEWRYAVSKTKSQHIVPLARQALTVLKELHPITQHSQYVFPAATSPRRPMSDNAILAAFRRMEIPKDQMSGHGFRAMAHTILGEVLDFLSPSSNTNWPTR